MVIGRLEPFGAKIAQYFPCQRFLDFGMPRYGFDDAGTGVYPQRVLSALPFQVATGHAQPLFQIDPLHKVIR